MRHGPRSQPMPTTRLPRARPPKEVHHVADSDLRAAQDREPVRFLVFSASLRADSLNGRLARLAATTIEANGGVVDFRPMSDFEAPSYNADVQGEDGFPPGADRLRECV